MAITIVTTTENTRTILTATGDANTLSELWNLIPGANKENIPGSFILTGNVSLILNCTIKDASTGIKYIGLKNGADLKFGNNSSLTFGNAEISSQSIAEIIGGIFQTEVETGWTFSRMLRLFASVLGGKITTKPENTTTTFRSISDTYDALDSIADVNSDRSQIVYKIPATGTYQISADNKPLYSEELIIPITLANTDVVIMTSKINNIVDIKYIFESAVKNTIRVNKAEVSGKQITLNFSISVATSKLIVVGSL